MLRLLRFEGTPAQMGEAFGESCRDEIAALYALRLENALDQARRYGGRSAQEADLLALAGACLEACATWHPAGADELRGIARGAALPPEKVLAMNGLTDLRDALAWGAPPDTATGCTAFIVQRDQTADGQLWAGQTWDLGTGNLPHVVAVARRPHDGPETWCVTTVGCLSLMGMNGEGVAVGTTNLRTTDARVGVPYLSVIHAALEMRSAAAASQRILEAPRGGGHSYTVVDRHGGAYAIECTARRGRRMALRGGFHVHTNHCQLAEHRAIEAAVSFASSEARLARMRTLLRDATRVDRAYLTRCLADTEGGKLAICRDDFDGISTNAALLVGPEGPVVAACQGLPTTARWRDLVQRGDS
jgi:isopenicillin-N N-acyltransferase-like protein